MFSHIRFGWAAEWEYSCFFIVGSMTDQWSASKKPVTVGVELYEDFFTRGVPSSFCNTFNWNFIFLVFFCNTCNEFPSKPGFQLFPYLPLFTTKPWQISIWKRNCTKPETWTVLGQFSFSFVENMGGALSSPAILAVTFLLAVARDPYTILPVLTPNQVSSAHSHFKWNIEWDICLD